MAIMSNQTRKVPDLPTLVNVTDGDVVLVHSGAGLKKVPVSTLKRTFATPQQNISVATSSSNGIVRPDNSTTEVNGGVLKAKTATRGSVGVVKPDGSTINIDGNGTLSVNKSGLNINSVEVSTKIINQNGNQPMKWWYGTKSQYNALSYKDPNTVYDCSEG
jgi:hypothetical protein|nr:MAG TPA: 39S ribosomal protein L2 [Caudoviricetes sp.]